MNPRPARSGPLRPSAVFQPHSWMPGPHAQTLVGRWMRSRVPGPHLTSHWVDTPDGDELEIAGPNELSDGPVVLVLHGLEGSAQRGYVRSMIRILTEHNLNGYALNFRGCGSRMNRKARLYHSGETEDPAVALRWLRERHPDRRVGAVGFSLGGNMLLKHLGESGSGADVDAAVAISVPFDLERGVETLESSAMGTVYSRYFLRSLKGKIRRKADLLRSRIDLESGLRARSLREFDGAITAPLHGFSSAEDYYRRSSCAPWISSVGAPTLVLHSRDDPFLVPDAIPEGELRANSLIEPWILDRGGHVGFVTRGAESISRFWGEELAAEFLASRLA